MTTYAAVPVRAEPAAEKRIDYARMQGEWPKQKRALQRAVKTGDATKVAAVCIEAVKVWDEVGAWPDDWSLFERALNDLLHWRGQCSLSEVAYGSVRIEAVPV